MKLIIVESPAKAKTISRFLSKVYVVESSYGHIRDLPKKTLGIDVENNFEPHYEIMADKKKQVASLKKLAKQAEIIYFATDEDREGEAISWHLAHILSLDPTKVARITFHEITKKAIVSALQHPRSLDINRVDAQQARRVLDRIVGYELSPFLWKKVARGLSAGRVQSVAVRLIVEREREIRAFIPQEYWTIHNTFADEHESEKTITAVLTTIDEKKLDTYELATEHDAMSIVEQLKGCDGEIQKIEQKEKSRKPQPPFITSTLQQAAYNSCGFSAKQTMGIAQKLYEGIEVKGEGSTGLITYMRTDSVQLSEEFVNDARTYITKTFSANYCPQQPITYATKAANAQEAHEAIRPTDVNRRPEDLQHTLSDQQFKLYDLIWRRAVACQMEHARYLTTSIHIVVKGHNTKNYGFKATGSVITFEGFMAVYTEQMKDTILPAFKESQRLRTQSITPAEHHTEPPPRYNDASIVKILEEYGIGRPSTFAPTIATIEARGYVERLDRKRLAPTQIGELVNDVLLAHFPNIVDYDFTADMEQQLDTIASGTIQWKPVIAKFYTPFKENLVKKTEEVKREDVMTTETDKVCPDCTKPIMIKMGRFGKFYACTGYPDCKHTEPLEGEKKAKKPTRAIGMKCVMCTVGDIVERTTKRNKLFYGCNTFPKCAFALWGLPTGEKCPTCNELLMLSGKTKIKCSSKECTFNRKKTDEDDMQINANLKTVMSEPTDTP